MPYLNTCPRLKNSTGYTCRTPCEAAQPLDLGKLEALARAVSQPRDRCTYCGGPHKRGDCKWPL